MKSIQFWTLFRAALVLAATATLGISASLAQTGGVTLGNSIIEPAYNDANGSQIYILETQKSPFPVKANTRAWAPLYAIYYPVQSSLLPSQMDCQPTNCDHDNVDPFPFTSYYGPAPDVACQDFNGGNPCYELKGTDILLGLASTGGDFNVAWHVEIVYFTQKAFGDGAINTLITTLTQFNQALANGDIAIIDTPIAFSCSPVSQQTYALGTPEIIPYP